MAKPRLNNRGVVIGGSPSALHAASSSGLKTQANVLPPGIGLLGALLLVCSFGPNALLAVFSIILLFLGSWLLWRPGESPILLFVFGYQWMQASTKIFHANWLNQDVAQVAPYGGDVQLAILLSLSGLAVLTLGMRLGAGPWTPENAMLLRERATAFRPRYWFRLYAVALLAATLAQGVAWFVPGLTQPLLAVASIKWAFFWILAYASFAQPRASRLYLLAALGIELAIGLGGYFADFKTPLLFALFALVAAGLRLSPQRYLALGALVALLVSLAVTWTAVKGEYRNFVSGGQRAQVVTVDYAERVAYLSELVKRLNSEDISDASNALLERLAYVDFFGVVIDRVPNLLPHEGGALWWDAIKRPFMPRVLFPEKTVIHDTERTNYYTGLGLAGHEQGTSFSLGYIAESYIDFGIPLMMVPIFVLGLILGRFYTWMIRLDRGRILLGMALATSTVYVMAFLESSITKTFGSLVLTMIASWVCLRFIAPQFFPNGRARHWAPGGRRTVP